jgi:hypothetical protein
VLAKFRDVYEKMHSALDGMPYAELAISDEVKEQVSWHGHGHGHVPCVSISAINSES